MDFENSTSLDSNILREIFADAIKHWPPDPIRTRVRWSRGADFSGTCIYDTRRIYINLGRHLTFPYAMRTYCARSRKAWGQYYKPTSTIYLADGYQVCLFVFAHEYYHWLIKKAGRNTAQKESMCDRFAARILVDQYGCRLCDKHGRPMPRREWDIQDLDGFVAAARSAAPVPRAARLPRPPALPPAARDGQFLLFG